MRKLLISSLGRLRTDEADDALVLQLLDRTRQLFLRHAGHREADRIDAAGRTLDHRELVGLEQPGYVRDACLGSEADQRIGAPLDDLIALHRGGVEAAALALAHEHSGEQTGLQYDSKSSSSCRPRQSAR